MPARMEDNYSYPRERDGSSKGDDFVLRYLRSRLEKAVLLTGGLETLRYLPKRPPLAVEGREYDPAVRTVVAPCPSRELCGSVAIVADKSLPRELSQ